MLRRMSRILLKLYVPTIFWVLFEDEILDKLNVLGHCMEAGKREIEGDKIRRVLLGAI